MPFRDHAPAFLSGPIPAQHNHRRARCQLIAFECTRDRTQDAQTLPQNGVSRTDLVARSHSYNKVAR
jgi:hypothetical protein